MTINKIRTRVSKSIFLKLSISAIAVVLLILYFKAFFTTGVYFEDTYLKKITEESGSYYTGKDNYGSIKITVKGIVNRDKSSDVIFKLPNEIYRHYIVTFKNERDWGAGIENIKDGAGSLLFSGGTYRKDYNVLFDESGKPLMGDLVQVRVSGKNPYIDNYEIPLSSVAGFATFSMDTFRGKYYFLAVAIVLLLFTLIDIKFPLFFFTLRNMWDVRDPEPSDFYITMQKFSWYAVPVVSIVLMIVAIS